jgi:hypothetical protein
MKPATLQCLTAQKKSNTPNLFDRPWTREEDKAIRDLTHWTMRGGQDRNENPREWISVAQILNESVIAKKIQGGRWYTKENVASRYHHYIKFNCETKAEWDARVATVQAEFAREKSRKLSEMTAEYSQERGGSIHKAAALAQMAREAQYKEEAARDTAEQAKAYLEADKAKKANLAQAARKQRDAFALNEAKSEKFVWDRESALEKVKVAEAERVVKEQLEAGEENLRTEEEAKEVAKGAGNADDGVLKRFNPFEGKPLDKNFPKTPMNFHKGEVKGRVKEAAKKAGYAEGGKAEDFNPFEGVPLDPSFPKTPMNFYKGEVVRKGLTVSSHQTAKTAAKFGENRNRPKAPEETAPGDEPAKTTEERNKGKDKQSNLGWMLNDEPWCD